MKNNRGLSLVSLLVVILLSFPPVVFGTQASKKEVSDRILHILQTDKYLSHYNFGERNQTKTTYNFTNDHCTLVHSFDSPGRAQYVIDLGRMRIYLTAPASQVFIELGCVSGSDCSYMTQVNRDTGARETHGIKGHTIGGAKFDTVEKLANALAELKSMCTGKKELITRQTANVRRDLFKNSSYGSTKTFRSGEFHILANMYPKRESNYNSYHATCTEGGGAFVNVRFDNPNIFAWSGVGFSRATAGSDIGIGIEEALRKACRGG